jgi:uncharacterized damage-inducible protein DinB
MDITLTPEHAAFFLQYGLGELGFESGVTKKVVAAIPESNKGYKPDASSRSCLELAHHIILSEEFFLKAMLAGKFDWVEEPLPPGTTISSLVARYEKSIPELSSKVAALPSDKLTAPLSFFGMFNHSAVYYFSFMLHHSIHHRGQLAACLRAAGGKVPSIYGGSFDEPMS